MASKTDAVQTGLTEGVPAEQSGAPEWTDAEREAKIRRLTLDNEDLRFDCARLDAALTQAQGEILSLSDLITRVRAENSALSERIAQAEAEIAALSERNAEMAGLLARPWSSQRIFDGLMRRTRVALTRRQRPDP